MRSPQTYPSSDFLPPPPCNVDPAANAPAAVRTAPARELPVAICRRAGGPLSGDSPRATGADPKPTAQRNPRDAPLERQLAPPQSGGLHATGPPAASAGVRGYAAVSRGAARD